MGRGPRRRVIRREDSQPRRVPPIFVLSTDWSQNVSVWDGGKGQTSLFTRSSTPTPRGPDGRRLRRQRRRILPPRPAF